MKIKMSPELHDALCDLVMAAKHHKDATETFLILYGKEPGRNLEKTHLAVADAGHEVARVALASGVVLDEDGIPCGNMRDLDRIVSW